jgi:4-hydroxy-tetrahydrodipicolinate reductase
MIRLGVVGAAGRMGQAIAEALVGRADAVLARGLDAGDDGAAVTLGEIDVLIDFSNPRAIPATLALATRLGVPVIIGTTGLEPAHHGAIDRAAASIPVLQTGNTSLGVTLLAYLVREAAARLGRDWDIEIVEMHHRHKVDAPSGTALLLGEAAAAGRAVDLALVAERGRDGVTGPRSEDAIGFASLRGGSVSGDHNVIFAGEGERIELGHRAESRAIFARGAVQAALWLVGQAPGRYTMRDVLGIA